MVSFLKKDKKEICEITLLFNVEGRKVEVYNFQFSVSEPLSSSKFII
jgi:hypothetical protein